MRDFYGHCRIVFEFLYGADFRKCAPLHGDDFISANQMCMYMDYIIGNNPKDFTRVAFNR